jgi:hypothetical protein
VGNPQFFSEERKTILLQPWQSCGKAPPECCASALCESRMDYDPPVTLNI